jgi:hypothetical protein
MFLKGRNGRWGENLKAARVKWARQAKVPQREQNMPICRMRRHFTRSRKRNRGFLEQPSPVNLILPTAAQDIRMHIRNSVFMEPFFKIGVRRRSPGENHERIYLALARNSADHLSNGAYRHRLMIR